MRKYLSTLEMVTVCCPARMCSLGLVHHPLDGRDEGLETGGVGVLVVGRLVVYQLHLPRPQLGQEIQRVLETSGFTGGF